MSSGSIEVVEGSGFSDQATLIRRSNRLAHQRIAETIPGVLPFSMGDPYQIRPSKLDHYLEEKEFLQNGEKIAEVDIHYIGGTPLHVMFPMVVRLGTRNPEAKKGWQTDIYSIDANGNVLAHTNIISKDTGVVETKDNSIENLHPYLAKIIEVSKLPMRARMRLEGAESRYRSNQNT